MAGLLSILDDSSAATLEGAGFGIRALARLLDAVIHFSIAVASGVFAGILIGVAGAILHIDVRVVMASFGTTRITGYLASLAGAAWLHVASESIHGSTLGKLLCGITVIREDGTAPPGFAPALRRNLAAYVDGLFFGAVAWSKMKESPRRQRIGDAWAKTMVVYRKDLPIEVQQTASRFVAGLALAMVGDGGVLFSELMLRLL